MLVPLLLASSIATAAPEVSGAEAFRAYELAHFYLYKQTEHTGFSCRIHLSQVDALVAGLRAKVAAGELPMDIKDSLATFALNYTRDTDALEFTRPTLALAINEDAKVANLERLKEGMTQIFSGFNQQVEGAIGIAQGLLHEFLLSRHDAISDVQFEASSVGYQAEFSMDGGSTTTLFDGETKHSEIRIGSGVMTAKAHFKPNDSGKLVLQRAEMTPAPNQTMTMALTTRVIDGLIVPEAIEMKALQINNGLPTNSGIRIAFTHCSVR